MKAPSPARLEMVRLVREHATVVADGRHHGFFEQQDRDLAAAALATPIDVMAFWVQLDETVMANIQLAFSKVRSSMVQDPLLDLLH